MKLRLIVGILLLSTLAFAGYRGWSAPYCRSQYRTVTTWPQYERWFTNCQWGGNPEDAGCGVDTFTVTATATGTHTVTATGTDTNTVTASATNTITATATTTGTGCL